MPRGSQFLDPHRQHRHSIFISLHFLGYADQHAFLARQSLEYSHPQAEAQPPALGKLNQTTLLPSSASSRLGARLPWHILRGAGSPGWLPATWRPAVPEAGAADDEPSIQNGANFGRIRMLPARSALPPQSRARWPRSARMQTPAAWPATARAAKDEASSLQLPRG